MSSFVIKAVQSGAPGLSNQLPATGYTVGVLTDSRGVPAFHAVLQTPIRFYYDSRLEGSRIEAERFGRDEQGPFLWVTEVIITAHRADDQPYPGMTDFAMDLSALLVPVDDDTESLRDNTAAMGLVFVDDAPDAPAEYLNDVVDGDGPTQPDRLTAPVAAPPAQSAGPPPPLPWAKLRSTD